jgi:hypothetical protein
MLCGSAWRAERHEKRLIHLLAGSGASTLAYSKVPARALMLTSPHLVGVIKISWPRHKILSDTLPCRQFLRCTSDVHIPMSNSIRLRVWPKRLAPWLAQAYLVLLTWMLPVAPLCASLLFGRRKYVLDYVGFIRRMRVHIAALREGPALHYFEDVMGRVSAVPAEIAGECVQCGNCCMNKRCVFLEPIAEGRYQCGIYHSPFRRWSNCGSFPLNAHDIARYACPSYHVVQLKRKPR